MASKEPYDYVATVSADVDVTLSITPHGVVTEESRENTIIHIGDDESEERIILSSTPVFFVSFQWAQLSESDSGTVLDLYHTSAQGKGKSFKWVHDSHTYVVRFDCDLSRAGDSHDRYGSQIKLKILGKIVDA
jgi:hypothetical protein